MGIHRGPNLIKDNLVFGYDSGYGVADNNTATRFYEGESTDNKLRLFTSNTLSYPSNIYRCTVTEQNIVDVTAPNGQYSRYTGIDGSDNNQVFYSYAGGGFNYTGQTITYSVYLKGSGTCHLTTYDNSSGYGTSGTITLINEWVRYSYTRSVSSSASSHWSGVRGILSSTDVYVAASQMEIKGHATPFTPTTRSDTESLIDLKKTIDIDVSNVSFNSTGQPEFDGTDDRIDLGYAPITGIGDFTITSVYKTNTSAANTIIGNYPNGNLQFMGGYGLYIAGSCYFTSTPLPAGTYCATATRENGVCKIYLNGKLQRTVNNSNDIGISSFRIGTNTSGTEPFNGGIYNIKVYDRALSADEVKQNYNAYKNRFNI